MAMGDVIVNGHGICGICFSIVVNVAVFPRDDEVVETRHVCRVHHPVFVYVKDIVCQGAYVKC